MARFSVIGTPPGREYPQTNGWTFWQMKGASGELIEVDAVRRQFGKSGGRKRRARESG